jgi:hypothetical protein
VSTHASVAQQPGGKPSSDSDGRKPGLGNYVSFPACGIRIRQPDGLEKASSFDGFGHPEIQASVVAVRLAAPYSKAITGFNPEQLSARGWTLLSRLDVKVDDLPGILVHFEQPTVGQVFLKWSLVFGDEQRTTIVTATIPKANAEQLAARLKDAVLSTRLDRASDVDPGSDLPFTIVSSSKLKLTPLVSKTLAYTRDGVVPLKSPKDPLFIAASSLGEVVAGDKRQFAERAIRQAAQTKGLVLKSTEAITIDGLDGYESLAEATDAQSETPLVVYQAILFDGTSYIVMQGLVGRELRDQYLPEFKAMTRSLKRKQR